MDKGIDINNVTCKLPELHNFLTGVTDSETVSQLKEELIASVAIVAKPPEPVPFEEVVWLTKPKNRDRYVHHELNVSESAILSELLREFSDVLYSEDSLPKMGQALFEFDIELKEGGEEILAKIGHELIL